MNNIKPLAKKYFWEQKFKEIGLVLLIILGIFLIIIVSYGIGKVSNCRVFDSDDDKIFSDEKCSSFSEFMCYGVLILVLTLLIISIPSFLIYFWIKSNIDKARKRAVIKIYGEEKLEKLREKLWRGGSLRLDETEIEAVNRLYNGEEKWDYLI